MIEKVTSFSRLFHALEEDRFEQLEGFKWNGIVLWQIVKIPLYFQILKGNFKQKDLGQSNKYNLVKLAVNFWWNVFFLKKGKYLFVRSTTHARTSNHKYIHVTFDNLVREWQLKDPVFLDIDVGNVMTTTFQRKTSVYLNHLFHLKSILRFVVPRRKFTGKPVTDLRHLINRYFECKEVAYRIKQGQLESIVSNFWLEYKILSVLYRFLQPKALFLVDGFATANLFAARRWGIPVIEFQHGLFDEFYPNYNYSWKFNKLKSKLVFPSHIAVFGKFFKELLLKGKFWEGEEICVIGKPGISKRVRELPVLPNQPLKILHPTQGDISFQRSKVLLKNLTKMEGNRQVLLKPHPQEPEQNLEFFKRLATENPSNFAYVEPTKDITEALLEAHIVIGFDSTSLLEAVAMGIPTMTIASSEMPKGIITMTNASQLEKAILVTENDTRAISKVLLLFETDELYRATWRSKCIEIGEYLFETDYAGKVEEFLTSLSKCHSTVG